VISSKSRDYLLKDYDPIGLSTRRSVDISKWTVLIGRTGFYTMYTIPDPTLSLRHHSSEGYIWAISARRYLQLRGVGVAVSEWYDHLVVAIIVVSRQLSHELGVQRPGAYTRPLFGSI